MKTVELAGESFELLRPEEVVEVVDPAPFLGFMEERFGIPPESFSEFLVFRPNRRHVSLIYKGMLLPSHPPSSPVGLSFVNDRSKHFRPSYDAILRFGYLARRHVIDLDKEQLQTFIDQGEIRVRPEQEEGFQRGVVILRRSNVGLMSAFWPGEEEPGVVRGHVPRPWLRLRTYDPLAVDADEDVE